MIGQAQRLRIGRGAFALGSMAWVGVACGGNKHEFGLPEVGAGSGGVVQGGSGGSAGKMTAAASSGSGDSGDGGEAGSTEVEPPAPTSGGAAGAAPAGSGGLGTAIAGFPSAGGAGKPGTSVGGSAGTGGTPACTVCGGSCVDLAMTKQHCGACDYACVNGRECVAGRCTPAWQPIATSAAPTARSSHAAVFIAGKYVVLGGCVIWDGPAEASTGAYDPATDRWSTLAPLKTARGLHQAVSTGTQIYTFGGLTACSSGTGSVGPGLERFVPDSGQGVWTTISAAGAPEVRYNFSMVWTGAAIMVFGGHLLLPTSATGGLFDPASSSWADASCTLVNCDRSTGAFFKDGNLIRFMGGEYNLDYPDWKGNGELERTGLSYNPGTKTWSTWPHPQGTPAISTSPWADDGRRIYFPTGGSVGIYDRKTGWLARDAAPMPTGLCAGGATYAWSGTELIGWGGNCSQATAVGARYQPAAPP